LNRPCRIPPRTRSKPYTGPSLARVVMLLYRRIERRFGFEKL
jgi:hypothetical protein